ncbi:MAG: SDR family NAD(P)-dependent oxidoreductase, partial [Sphingomicrobium sp.]
MGAGFDPRSLVTFHRPLSTQSGHSGEIAFRAAAVAPVLGALCPGVDRDVLEFPVEAVMSKATDKQKLDGKVAIITGATGGIGEATAKLFLELGAKVMLVARSADKLDATKGRLEAHGEVAGSISDAADEAGMAAAVTATLDRFGGLDILVANAGTEGVLKPIEALSVEEFEDTMRTNVTG